MNHKRHVAATLAGVTALGLLGACGSDGNDQDGGGKGDFKIAFLAASSQNGFNRAFWDGIEQRAEELGVDATILDGEFDANVQFTQLQDISSSGQYDGVVVVPNDNVGLAAAIPPESGVPVVSVLFPLGSDITALEPQVDGVVATVASDPAVGAASQAEKVVDFCADQSECTVAILIGQLRFPFDKMRHDAYVEVLEQHDNIEIVTGEGNYDRDQSMKTMQDLLQAHPDIDAILSNADQHIFGAALAVEDAGLDLRDMYVIGAGGSTQAIEAVRNGDWDAEYVNFPVSMGAAAVDQLIADLTGENVESVVDADGLGSVPAIVDQDVLGDNPDFLGEWTD